MRRLAACLAVLASMALPHPVLAQNSQTSPRVEGSFRGTAPGFNQEMSIQKIDGDRYGVRASVAAPGCSAQFQGTGEIKEHMMVIRDAAGACTLTLMRAGPNVQIDAEECGGYSAACEFGGTYRRR